MSLSNNISLGQHWLKNRLVLEEIADLAGSGKLCIEIGPGLGFLTSSLLRRFDKVMAIEYDADLAKKLPGSFPGKNLEVINQDFLKYDLDGLPQSYVVAGNIPYYITSPIIEKILTAEVLPERVVLLIQKEVAERVVDEKETMLSLFVKNRAEVELGPVVKAEEFTPPPKVDSQVIVLKPHTAVAKAEVFKLISIGFSSPRKKAIKNLSVVTSRENVQNIFGELGLDIDARPGDLHLEDWQKLYNKMVDGGYLKD